MFENQGLQWDTQFWDIHMGRTYVCIWIWVWLKYVCKRYTVYLPTRNHRGSAIHRLLLSDMCLLYYNIIYHWWIYVILMILLMSINDMMNINDEYYIIHWWILMIINDMFHPYCWSQIQDWPTMESMWCVGQVSTGSPSSNTSFLVDSFSALILIAQFQKEQVYSGRKIALLMISTGNLHEHH